MQKRRQSSSLPAYQRRVHPSLSSTRWQSPSLHVRRCLAQCSWLRELPYYGHSPAALRKSELGTLKHVFCTLIRTIWMHVHLAAGTAGQATPGLVAQARKLCCWQHAQRLPWAKLMQSLKTDKLAPSTCAQMVLSPPCSWRAHRQQGVPCWFLHGAQQHRD